MITIHKVFFWFVFFLFFINNQARLYTAIVKENAISSVCPKKQDKTFAENVEARVQLLCKTNFRGSDFTAEGDNFLCDIPPMGRRGKRRTRN